MMSCQQATRLISESQERGLSLTEKMSLKVHVMMCTGCKKFQPAGAISQQSHESLCQRF
jgi:hypothetical protein